MTREENRHAAITLSLLPPDSEEGGDTGHDVEGDGIQDSTRTEAVENNTDEHTSSIINKNRHSESKHYFLNRAVHSLHNFMEKRSTQLTTVLLIFIFVAYLGYFIYAMYVSFGNEESVRLLVCTLVGVACAIWKLAGRMRPGVLRGVKRALVKTVNKMSNRRSVTKARKFLRWFFYMLAAGGASALILTEVALRNPRNLIPLAGIFCFLAVSFVLCKTPEKINWHTVFWGMALQFWLAVFIRRTAVGAEAFKWLSSRLLEFLANTDAGSFAAFGPNYLEFRFVMQVMPSVILLMCVINSLYYLGVAQTVVASLGYCLSLCMGTSPIESVNTVANMFLSLAETPVLIKPFLADVSESELFAILTGGFASIAGSLFGVFVAFGAPPEHLLAASVMSAPAALCFAKLLYPDLKPTTLTTKQAYNVDVRHYGSLMGALARGVTEGLMLVAQIVINLLIYTALLAFVDNTVLWFAERVNVSVNFSDLLSYILYPLTFLMGFEADDCLTMARLLGFKIFTTTQGSYMELGRFVNNRRTLMQYASTGNNTWSWRGGDIVLEATNVTLLGGVISERSEVLATYMLCGFSNLSSAGILIGVMTSLAPSRMHDVIRLVTWSLVAGNIACFSTACVAGLLE